MTRGEVAKMDGEGKMRKDIPKMLIIKNHK